jgi:protein-tyrosine phosphatase
MLRQVALPDGLTKGSLYLCSMPGRFEPLTVFLEEVEKHEVNQVLCLVSDTEIQRKSPGYLTALLEGAVPAKVLRYAVPDYGLPQDTEGLCDRLDGVRELLDSGQRVVIHCSAGHGRTGMISTILLARMGIPLDQALKIINDAGSACDTSDQLAFVRNFSNT